AAVPQGDAPRAGTGVPVRLGHHDDQLFPAVRRAVRDDPGRTAEEHDQPGAAHVRAGLPLVAAGLRGGARVPAVRGDPGRDHGAGAAPGGAGAGMMRRLPGLLQNAVLIAGAALTVAPLLWMLSASLMPAGQANTSPPPLLPSRVTFEHYVELFSHLNLARAFGNSLLVSVLGTLATLVTSSMAGYAFAKLRFPGREGLFRLLLTAMLVPA